MARTVRNPMETRTPVRTISSVMRNAPRQQFRPRDVDRGRDDFGGQQRTPINQAVTSVVRPAGGQGAPGNFAPSAPREGMTTSPVPPVTSTGSKPATSVVKPVAPKTATTVKPASNTVKTAPKTATTGKTTAPVKPITSTTTKAPTAPIKPITGTKTPTTPKAPVKPITTPVAKTPVKPITSPATKPTTTAPKKSTSSGLTSILNNPIAKTVVGAGAGALLNKVLGTGKTTAGGTTKPGGATTQKPGGTTGGKPAGIPAAGGSTTTAGSKPAGIPAGGTTKAPAKGTPAAGAAAKTAATTAAKKAEIVAANPQLTEEEVQAELDRAKAEETFGGPPEDAVVAEDGTYKVTDSDGNISTYSADGQLIGYEGPEATTLTGGEETDTTAGNGPEDTVVGEGTTSGGATRSLFGGAKVETTGDTSTMNDLGEGYFQDDEGNIYGASGDLMYAVGDGGEYYDASGELIYDPSQEETTVDEYTWTDPDTGDVWNLSEDGSWSMEGDDSSVNETAYDENTWTDPDTGETWNLSDGGMWTLEGDDTVYDETAYDENTDYTVAGNEDDYSYYEEEPDVKKGGSIHRKTKGGLQRFADGDLVTEDGQISNIRVNQETGELYSGLDQNEYGDYYIPTATSRGYANLTALSDSEDATSSVDAVNDNGDGTSSYWDGDYYVTVDNDSGTELYRTDANGETVQTEAAPVEQNSAVDVQVDEVGNTVITDASGRITVYDPEGNVIPVGGGREAVGPVQSVGGNTRPSFATLNERVNPDQKPPDQTGVLDALKGYITDNPGLASGAIGALLASLMDQASSGESAGPSQPVDISALTAINPRTTDFGPGMTGGRTGTGSSIVSYGDYAEGYDNETPDERLYSDLGISGWLNEPEMTDYTDENGVPVDQYGNYLEGYGPEEETAAEEAVEAEEEPAMAAGGPTTHYTFGRVIDPAENLGIGQGMKKGGLSQAHTVHSHHTNPVINERVDFRKGSAVNGAGDGQSDDIPAWLADGEYVMDAELVSMLGNGSNKAGAKVLDKFREEIRAHKRSTPLGKIPPKAKSPLNYLKEAMNG